MCFSTDVPNSPRVCMFSLCLHGVSLVSSKCSKTWLGQLEIQVYRLRLYSAVLPEQRSFHPKDEWTWHLRKERMKPRDRPEEVVSASLPSSAVRIWLTQRLISHHLRLCGSSSVTWGGVTRSCQSWQLKLTTVCAKFACVVHILIIGNRLAMHEAAEAPCLFCSVRFLASEGTYCLGLLPWKHKRKTVLFWSPWIWTKHSSCLAPIELLFMYH